MGAPLVGIIVSAGCVALLSLLFTFERRQGVRLAAPVRKRFDRTVLSGQDRIAAIFSDIGKDMFPRLVRSFSYTVLAYTLKAVRMLEYKVHVLIRSNRLLVYRSKNGRTTRNKLDEIAEHKARIALSEEEKKRHKEALLQGE